MRDVSQHAFDTANSSGPADPIDDPGDRALGDQGWGSSASIVQIRGYRAQLEVLKCPAMSIEDGAGELESKYFRGGTLGRLEGEAHMLRRRVMNRLLRASGHQRFRDQVLYPTLERNLRDALAGGGENGTVKVELVDFLKRVTLQLVATFIGLEGAETRAGADHLLELQVAISRGAREALSEVSHGYSSGGILTTALEARQEYVDTYFLPAWKAHKAILGRVTAGELAPEAMPNDLMSLIVAAADPAWADQETAIKETLLILRGGINSSTDAICRALDEVLPWLDQHPDDRQRLDDPGFLLTIVNETMRLHPNQPTKLRRASEDVYLDEMDTEISAGTYALLCTKDNNRDAEIFGADAESFDPHRSVPESVQAHGLSFGAGRHRCYGVPLVLGSHGVDGSLVHTLRVLFAHYIQKDPTGEVTFEDRPQFPNSVYETYPILLALSPP